MIKTIVDCQKCEGKAKLIRKVSHTGGLYRCMVCGHTFKLLFRE